MTPEMENIFEKIHNENVSNIMDNKNNKFLTIMANGNKNKISNGINNNNLNNNINNNINGSLNNLNQNNHININGNLNVNQNQPSNNNIYISPNILMQYNQMKLNQGINGLPMNNMNNIQQNMHSIPNYGIQNMMMNPPMNMPMFINQNIGGINNIMGMQMNNHQYKD